MKREVFGLDKFNIIEDEKYYYAFRALNSGDESDFLDGITSDNQKITKIRPDIARYNEQGKKSIFTDSREISLKEVWRHIRVNHTKDTNTISLTTNSNIVIDYGNGADHNKRYVLVKVPKNDAEKSNIYNAGLYMLQEIEKLIQLELEKNSKNSEIVEIIRKIDEAKTEEELSEFIEKVYLKPKTLENLKGKKKNFESYRGRFSKRKYFNSQQQLEYNRIIAKLSVLEKAGHLNAIMNVCKDNSSLIRTIGIAFSSSELLHYGEIQSESFIEISGKVVELISLLQQIDDTEKVKELKTRIIEYINNGYSLQNSNNKVVFSNNQDSIEIPEINSGEFFSSRDFEQSSLSIEDCYKITNGNLRYDNAKNLIEFYKRLCISRKKTLEYVKILEKLGADREIIEQIKSKSFIVDNNIITRQNDVAGYELSETISIAMNRVANSEIFITEQLEIIEQIKKFSEEQLNQVIKNTGIELETEIINTHINSDRNIAENEYYLEAIIDRLDLKNIYGKERILTDNERERIIKKFENVDCKKLYETFRKAGINPENIPYYIINLAIEKGYRDYSLDEFSKLENLESIIIENIKNWNLKITPYYFDKFIGIEDNKNLIEGSSIQLRDYQLETVNNIDEIYKEKRFAGVILPTGGGKSFVAMTEMLKRKKDNIVYIAPRTAILSQFKNHIIKNVLNIDIINENDKDNSRISDSGRERLTMKEAEERIKEVFPHLKMMCYQSLCEMTDKEIKELNPQFIVLDELHRAGANTWYPKVKTLINANQESKILGITATPERDDLSDALIESEDVEDKAALLDMMRNIALQTGEYTEKEIIQKKHLASELYLLDAIRLGYVVSPKIVSFDYTLEDSDEYKIIKNLYEEETDDSKKREYANALKQMNQIIENSKKKGIAQVISENINKRNGKFILFLPRKTNGKISSEEYIEQELEIAKNDFSEVDSNPETWYLLSGRKDASANEIALQEFELSETEHVKVLAAIDMLNEGVHVDGISGIIMKRKIDGSRKILYLQQIGRCIYAIDPDNPPKPDEVPVIFDMYNNYLVHDLNREINQGNTTSDLQRMISAVNWIDKHQYFPDINSEVIEEARKAIILKKIQSKYKRYLDEFDTSNLTESEIYEIEQILELGKREDIDLWEREIPERIIPPGEDEIDEIKIFEVTATQKKFIEVFNDVTRKNNVKLGKSFILKRTLVALKVLADNGFTLNNGTIYEDKEFKVFYDQLPQKEKDYLAEHGITEEFDLYTSYQEAKNAFYYRNSSTDKIFVQYSISDLKKCGIFEGLENSPDSKLCIDDRKFIKRGPKEFVGKNIITGTFFDEFGNIYKDKESQIRVRNTLKVLELISKSGIEINEKSIRNLNFEEFFESLIQEDKTELTKKGIKQDFNLVKEYEYVRNRFYYTNKDTDPIFETFEMEELKKMGIFENVDLCSHYDLVFCDKHNFLIRAPEKFKYKNIDTCTRFNKAGKRYEFYTKEFEYRILYILDILHNEGFKIDNDLINENTVFSELLSKVSQNARNELEEWLIEDEDFDIYKEYEEIKYKLMCGGWRAHEKFDKYSVKKLKELGLFESFINHKTGNECSILDHYGFVKPNTYPRLAKKNIYTLGYRTIDGYDIDGKDKNGCYRDTGLNDLGFDKHGINFETGEIVNKYQFNMHGEYCIKNEYGEWVSTGKMHNPRGFDIRKKHKATKCNYDEYSFDIDSNYIENDGTVLGKENPYGFRADKTHKDTGTFLNPENFDIDGYYYELQSDGSYKKTDKQYGKDGWSLKGINEKTHSIYDEDGYSKEGYNKYGFDRKGIHRNGTICDEHGFNCDGYFCKKDENGEYIVTDKKLNKHNFDRDGIWYIREGVKHSEYYEKINSRGFDIDGDYIGVVWNRSQYAIKKENTASKVDSYNFDIDGFWYKKDSNGILVNTGKKINNNRIYM